MSVDKFGRHENRSNNSSSRGPPGEGFKLTSDLNYDITDKRLCNLRDPQNPNDAVNLNTLRLHVYPCMGLNKDGNKYDAKSYAISNAANPSEANDVVTKSYLESVVPKKIDDKRYSFEQSTIQDVAYPTNDGDAVNIGYVKNNCIMLSKNGYDAKHRVIVNVKDPIKQSDAVNKRYVDNKTPSAAYWDGTKKQMILSFGNKRLADVSDPSEPGDTVTLRYLNNNTMKITNSGNWDANGKTITRLGRPRELGDAVNRAYLKEVLGNLGYTVYTNMHKGRAASTITQPDEWKSKVLESSWEDLFK